MGHVVDRDGFTKSANASNFDVDDLARAQFQRGLGVAPAMDGFIQADAGLELLLQPRMEVKIVMPERLLNHQQVESVKPLQMLDLVERVSRIGVATEDDLRPASADFLEDLNVPPGLHLTLMRR